jgi:hypothetical protein
MSNTQAFFTQFADQCGIGLSSKTVCTLDVYDGELILCYDNCFMTEDNGVFWKDEVIQGAQINVNRRAYHIFTWGKGQTGSLHIALQRPRGAAAT